MASTLVCSPNSDGHLSVKIAISNPGNRPAILEDAILTVPDKENLERINKDPDASIENGYKGMLNVNCDRIDPTAHNEVGRQ